MYVLNEKNLGFTGGNNAGFRVAQEMQSKYVFFLNNDTIVSANIFSLCLFLDAHQEIGLVGPLTFYYDSPSTIFSAGGSVDRNTGQIRFFGRGKNKDMLPEVIYCSFIVGVALVARTELIREIGGFSEDYFLTYEESELCVRVTDRGYRLAVLTTCCVWHKVSRSMKPESELLNYFVFRNQLWFVKRNSVNLHWWHILNIIARYSRMLILLAFKRHNIPAAKGLLMGTWDFLRGIRGAGRYKRTLRAE
jgi:hypothetical protein